MVRKANNNLILYFSNRIVSQNCFHSSFLHFHSHIPVETTCCVITLPYIECDVVAAYGLCLVADELIQCLTDVFATSLCIHTDIINISFLSDIPSFCPQY